MRIKEATFKNTLIYLPYVPNNLYCYFCYAEFTRNKQNFEQSGVCVDCVQLFVKPNSNAAVDRIKEDAYASFKQFLQEHAGISVQKALRDFYMRVRHQLKVKFATFKLWIVHPNKPHLTTGSLKDIVRCASCNEEPVDGERRLLCVKCRIMRIEMFKRTKQNLPFLEHAIIRRRPLYRHRRLRRRLRKASSITPITVDANSSSVIFDFTKEEKIAAVRTAENYPLTSTPIVEGVEPQLCQGDLDAISPIYIADSPIDDTDNNNMQTFDNETSIQSNDRSLAIAAYADFIGQDFDVWHSDLTNL